jgi:hypothetical protein
MSLLPSQVGTDWYYLWKEIYSSTDYAFQPATDDPDVRSRAEPPSQALDTAERYSTYRGGDTDSEDESINPDDDEEEEDLLSEKESESSSKDTNALLHGRLTEAEEEDLTRRIQQATILDTRQDHRVVTEPKRRDNLTTVQSMASVAGQSSAYTGTNITLKAVHSNSFLEGAMRARIFIQQVDNKIVDAAETSNKRKVRYTTSLLRGQAAE